MDANERAVHEVRVEHLRASLTQLIRLAADTLTALESAPHDMVIAQVGEGRVGPKPQLSMGCGGFDEEQEEGPGPFEPPGRAYETAKVGGARRVGPKPQLSMGCGGFDEEQEEGPGPFPTLDRACEDGGVRSGALQ